MCLILVTRFQGYKTQQVCILSKANRARAHDDIIDRTRPLTNAQYLYPLRNKIKENFYDLKYQRPWKRYRFSFASSQRFVTRSKKERLPLDQTH